MKIRPQSVIVHTILSGMFFFFFLDKNWVAELVLGYSYLTAPFLDLVMQSKKNALVFLIKNRFFKKRNIVQKKTVFLWFFNIIYNLKAGKCFFIRWSAYSYYIQVVKHYIQYVNSIFIDSETNYLINYNTNLHSNIKLHNYNL